MFTAWRLLVQVQYRPPTAAPNPVPTWIDKLSELRRDDLSCAMVVVTDMQGSVPRDAGARMIVREGKLEWGTIGGGNLEKLAIEHATAMLEKRESLSESISYPLAEKTGQCCGGNVTLFYETFPWKKRQLCVFGAGHVGQAVGGLASYLGMNITLIDGRREEDIQPRIPSERDYELLCIDAPEGEIDEIAEDAFLLIMTHSHALDLEVLIAALKRGTFPYIGLIGSDRKWKRFQKALVARGFVQEEIASVSCPVGATRVSKLPSAIAISTAAELLAVAQALYGARHPSQP